MSDEAFDWTKFFDDDDEEEVPAPAVVAAPPAGEDVSDLRAQLAKAQADSAKALELATQAQSQGKMQAAIDAWQAQATPAELDLKEMLLGSTSPDELQRNAQLVKIAAAKLNATREADRAKDRKDLELQLQKEYGMPIPPSHQPIPHADKVKDMLKEEDLSKAAGAMLEGFL